MGKPIKVTAEGRTFYICCDSCEEEVKTERQGGRRQARQAESRQQVIGLWRMAETSTAPESGLAGAVRFWPVSSSWPWKICSSHAILFPNVCLERVCATPMFPVHPPTANPGSASLPRFVRIEVARLRQA